MAVSLNHLKKNQNKNQIQIKNLSCNNIIIWGYLMYFIQIKIKECFIKHNIA